MNEKMLTKLEFHKISERLQQFASTTIGKERVMHLYPSSSLEEVNVRLQETDEAMTVLRMQHPASFSGIRDIRAGVQRARIGGILSPEELLDIQQTMNAAATLRKQLLSFHEDHRIDRLVAWAEQITEHASIERQILHAIDEHAQVRDQASEELRKIRHEIRNGESRIRDQMEQMIRQPSTQKMLQENIITIRNGRYVIPVKQAYRSYFGGIIHDQSASGATLFIEPEAIVQMNNRLRELALAEEKEVERILRRLSALIAEIEQPLTIMIKALAELDYIFAKAYMAQSMKASLPIMNDRRYFKIKKGRHPLIPMEEVRPIDVELGNDATMIIITGPNTGGKTVSLKTIGLLHLMAMSGLFVPAEDGSEFAVFDAVFADIGDEQSIEQNLSTFSSHLTNIISIINEMTPNSLILLDELGAGTDPAEGSALAIAILEYIHQRGCRIIATTHYSELKAYAFDREGILNASMEFDVNTLRPTYRLLIGIPGRSNALAIAERLGLPSEIIEQARGQVGEDDKRIDRMIATLEEHRIQAQNERETAEMLRREVEQLRTQLQTERDRFREQKEKLMRRAEQEAREAVNKAQQEAEQIIAELRKTALQEQASIKEHKLINLKKKLDEARPSIHSGVEMQTDQRLNKSLKPGDEVSVPAFGQRGTIIEEASESEWMVQLGMMKMKVKKSDVIALAKNKSSQHTTMNPPISTKSNVNRGRVYQQVKTELDVRGANLEDALIEVDRFLDDAVLANLNQVSIIHGKGTGVLGKGIHEYLKSHPHVKQYRFGTFHEGGNGVTIAQLS